MTFNQNIFLILAVVGVLLTLTIKDKQGAYDFRHTILLTIWMMGTVYASTKGIRFTLLLVPAFAIAFGAAFGISLKVITNYISREFKVQKVYIIIPLFILFSLIFFFPVKVISQANNVAAQDVPIVNDAWYDSMKKIQADSQPNAIISSWWDFGHHFKALADRPVTFDGTTQDQPQAHWIGKVLLTGDEREAVGIMRMLDCGGNSAFDVINAEKQDSIASINIVYSLVKQDIDEAEQTLIDEGISQPENVLQYTHCNPPEGYFVASEDMVGKSGVWGHFGSWNFDRAKIWRDVRGADVDTGIQYLQDEFGYSPEEAQSLYFEVQAIPDESAANTWVAPWPSYTSGKDGCSVNKEIVQCGSGVIVNLTDGDAYISTNQGLLRPVSVVYPTKDGVSVREFNESVIPQRISVIIFPVGTDGYQSITAVPEMADSMFTRMFFMGGHGLTYFDRFSDKRSITGQQILVFKMDWEGKTKELFPRFTTKTYTVNFIGWLDDGTVFDSSISGWQDLNITQFDNFEGNYSFNPLSFRIGIDQIIEGFRNGVEGREVGDEFVLNIPPEEAYGTDPNAHPLGNQTLHFRLRVESIE